jgi:hypothetical protein
MDWTKIQSRVLSHSADYSRARAASAHAYAAGYRPATATRSPPNKRCLRPAVHKGPPLVLYTGFELAIHTRPPADGGSAESVGQEHRPSTHAQVMAAQAAGRVRAAEAGVCARARPRGSDVAAGSERSGEAGREDAAHVREGAATLRHALAALIASDCGIAGAHRAGTRDLTGRAGAAGTDVANPACRDAGARTVAGTGACGGRPKLSVPAGALCTEQGQSMPGGFHELGPTADGPCTDEGMGGSGGAGGDYARLPLTGGLEHGFAAGFASAGATDDGAIPDVGRFGHIAVRAGTPSSTDAACGPLQDGPGVAGGEDRAVCRAAVPGWAGLGYEAEGGPRACPLVGEQDVSNIGRPGHAQLSCCPEPPSPDQNDFPPGVSIPRLSPQPTILLQAPGRYSEMSQPEPHRVCSAATASRACAPGKPLSNPPRHEDGIEPSQHRVATVGASPPDPGGSAAIGSALADEAHTSAPLMPNPARSGAEAAPVGVAEANALGVPVPHVEGTRVLLRLTEASPELAFRLPQACVTLSHLGRPAHVLDPQEPSGQAGSGACAENDAAQHGGGDAQMKAEAAGAQVAPARGKFRTRSDRERDLGHLWR